MDPPTARLRAALPRDAPVLRAHWLQLMARWGIAARARSAEREAFARWFAHERRRGRIQALLAHRARAPIGSAALWMQERQPRPGFDGGPVPRLLYVHVEPAAAHDGVAEALICRLLAWCRSNGHGSMQAHASGADGRLLRRLGFKRTNEFWLARPPLRIP